MGRAPTRGRAGGRRGRGGGQSDRGDIVAAVLQERQQNFRARIEEMSDEERKQLLIKAGELHPSLLLHIIDRPAPQGGFHPQPSAETPDWCTCLKCRDMPTQAERICCGRPANQCQSLLPDFNLLILDDLVLQVAQMYRQDVLALPQDEDYNKGKRHAAYRQYILWHHGRLGVGVRRIIPSCCVWAIRDKYPDQYGQYVGFVPSRLG
nr:P2X purinoceptor 7-like [Crassostrea virginica]